MLPSAATILASVAIFTPFALALDHCKNPGEYTCAIMLSADLLAFPDLSSNGAVLSENNGIEIVDGGCNSIYYNGTLEPQSPGFYGDFWTTYSTELKFWADYISSADIDGINFLYGGNWYYEKECSTTKWGFVSIKR